MRADFPNIPQLFIEAYTEVNAVQIPTTVDWVGFDHYGIANVATDANYLAWLDTLESRRTANQKIILVFDDEWNSSFWPGGWQPDTMEQVMSHYYDLALADTNVIGLVGFTWPGIATGWLGARSLPQNVTDKAVQLGKMIKANYSPCAAVGVEEKAYAQGEIKIYPNPATDLLSVVYRGKESARLKIYNTLGGLVNDEEVKKEATFSLQNLVPGIYYYRLSDSGGTILQSGKLVKE